MATLSREQTAQILYQAGFRGDALTNMVAIAGRESSYQTTAHRTDRERSALSGDRGLWQINYIWDQQLMSAGIIKSKSDLFDPLTNARAAFMLSKGGKDLSPWTAAKGGWTSGGSWSYGVNMDAARSAVQRAASQGLLGQDWKSSGGGVGSQPNPNAGTQYGSGTANSPSGPTSLPSDAKLVRNQSGLFAVFNIGAGVFIHYGVGNGVQIGGKPIESISNAEWTRRYQGSVSGGNAAELGAVAQTFGAYGKFWDSILNQTMGTNNPARNDPGVRRVLAEFAGRPDMTPAELENRLKSTPFWNSRTEGELAWNSLPEAERAARRKEMESRMRETWRQFTGGDVTMTAAQMVTQVETLASGKMGIGAWTEKYVKPRALTNRESPWSRQLRDEGETQRERGISIENTVSKIRATVERWGLQWGEPTLVKWAQSIVEQKSSDEDLLKAVRTQAKVLYPWKDEATDTTTAAAPWMETYSRVMENDATLRTPEVAKALQSGQGVWDFEQGLKKSNKWLDTKNARSEMFSLVSEAGRRMGFGE